VFVGCEGDGERGYVGLLQRFADESFGLRIHFDATILNPGAGDPLALIQRACRILKSRGRGRYLEHALFLDGDRLRLNTDRNREARRLAAEAGIFLVVQDPDLEAFLLRHCDGCQQLRPAIRTRDALVQRWPDYVKPYSTAQLATRVVPSDLVAACRVEHELRNFLRRIQFPL
jgi:hypothetical protein